MARLTLASTVILFIVACALPAVAQMFTYEFNPYSSVGRVTGGKCGIHGDCINSYVPHNGKTYLLCLTRAQSKGKKVGPQHMPDMRVECGCLPDVKRCGYAPTQELYK